MTALPKLVATDLDGTLVRSDNTVSMRSSDVLKRLAAKGVHIVGITGRGPRLLQLCRTDVPSADHLVMAQGSYIFDTGHDSPKMLRSHAFPGEQALSIVETIEAVAGPLTVLVESGSAHGAPLLGDEVKNWPFAVPIHTTDRESAHTGNIVKSFLLSESKTSMELLALANELIGPERAEFTESGLGFVEVCPPGATKAAGLMYVCDRLDVSVDDVLAFGDATNDLSMLSLVGHSVAMGNAHPRIKSVAADTTATNDDDGVASYLERIFGI